MTAGRDVQGAGGAEDGGAVDEARRQPDGTELRYYERTGTFSLRAVYTCIFTRELERLFKCPLHFRFHVRASAFHVMISLRTSMFS